MDITALQANPEGLTEGFEHLKLIDTCFKSGFSRLTEVQKESLQSFTNIFSATRFEAPLTEAVEEIVKGNFQLQYFKIIAGARMSLTGSMYDSLINELEKADGISWTAPDELAFADEASPLLDSCMEWLKEIAINGFESLEHSQLQPFNQTLENLMKSPEHYRQSCLLIGFINELSQSIPVSAMDSIPLRRWADLWSKAVMNSVALPQNDASKTVSGDLYVLGTDIFQHNNCVSMKCYGILKDGEQKQFVDFSITSYKVATIIGQENWKLFAGYPVLMKALSLNKYIAINGLSLVSNSTLVWDESKVAMKSAYAPMDIAKEDLKDAVLYKSPSFDRHYIHIIQPVFLENYKVSVNDDECSISIDGTELPLDTDRLTSMSVIDLKMIKASKQCFGFIRFDGEQWFFQILSINAVIKKKEYCIHNATSAMGIPKDIGKKSRKGDSFEILKERSSRLLRG